MKKIKQIFTTAYNKKVDSIGLAIFRICFSFVLLCDVFQLFRFRHLIFDKVPYLIPSEIDFTVPIILWMITLVFIFFGLFTRTASILNYIFSLIFLSTIDTYEYHMYYIYIGVSFILMFARISKRLSLDTLFLKLKYSNTRVTYNPPKKTSVLSYYIILFVGIGLVYFDSIFYKFASPMWLNGLGVWLPSSVAQITNTDSSLILNQKWLVIFLNYLTLALETLFIFTFFRKKWRVPLLLIGMALHLGIAIQFPIHWFGLGYFSLYLLMVPIKYWKAVMNFIRFKDPKLTFFYDQQCPLCNRTKIIIEHLDVFNAIQFKGVQTYASDEIMLKNKSMDDLLDNIYSVSKDGKVYEGVDTYRQVFLKIPLLFILSILLFIPGFYHIGKYIYKLVAKNRFVDRCTEDNCGFKPSNFPVNNDSIKLTKTLILKDLKITIISFGFICLILLQFNVITHSLVWNKMKTSIGLDEHSILIKYHNKVSYPIYNLSKVFFGITAHAIFVDSHFEEYNHTIAVLYRGKNKDIWLPITNNDGSLGAWQIGPVWAKWGFRANAPKIDTIKLERSIRDFTSFWAHKNNISLDDAVFLIKVKKNDNLSGWEENALRNQLKQPWIEGGTVKWVNKKFIPNIMDIESL